MKLSESQIVFIRSAFQEMKSKPDLLALLNYAKSILYGPKAIPFELKNLTYNSQHIVNRYKYFEIKKKNGGVRGIHAPVKGLKQIQKCLNIIFHAIFQPNDNAMGFITGKSVVDNATRHTGMHYVYNIDLKDFFPAIEEKRVFACLKITPFNLKDEPSKIQLAHIISRICCIEMPQENSENELTKTQKRVLPQGAPTSPIITNIICQKLDRQLTGLANYYGLYYSRYVDDITFSSLHNVFNQDHKFIHKLRSIIINQGFTINESKVRLQKKGFRQEVTGLTVNEKANVQRRYIQQLRGWLYKWERYGWIKAEKYFQKEYFKDQGHIIESRMNINQPEMFVDVPLVLDSQIKIPLPAMQNVISGKLQYLKIVRGADDKLYKKLNSRFLGLITELIGDISSKDLIDEVLETINVDSFEKGMDIYISKLK